MAPRPVAARLPFAWMLAVAVTLAACEEPDGSDLAGEPDVESVPGNVLSCRVRWSTVEPAVTRVEFGSGDRLEAFVGPGTAATEHDWLVIGLRAGIEHTLEAVSGFGDGTEHRSAPMTFTPDDLPFDPPGIEISILHEDLAQPGWTLFNVVDGDAIAPTLALMVDLDGEIVWYHDLGPHDGGGDVEVTLVDGERVLIGGSVPPGERPVEVDLAGEVVWEGPEQPDGLYTAGGMHHSMVALPGGDHLGLFYDFRDSTLVDVIQQLTPDGDVAWSWHPYDELGEDGQQYLHGNMVDADLGRGVAWYNARHVNRLYQIDRADGAVDWSLGEDGDFDFVGDAEHPWFLHPHAPEVHGDGSVLMYDNGSPELRPFSRVVEYQLDEAAMTASLIWEYPGDLADDDWYTFAWGDADRLDNGNTLITAAGLSSYDTPGRLLEVTHDGDIAWEALLGGPSHKDHVGVYASERIPVLVGQL